MKHKIAKIDGPLLDAAVAKAEGEEFVLDKECAVRRPDEGGRKVWLHYPPSREWAYGGPIMQRERIVVAPRQDGDYLAGTNARYLDKSKEVLVYDKWGIGPTPLIAAMRAFVASKFGTEVELP